MLEIKRDIFSVSGIQWKAMKALVMLAAVTVAYYCLSGNVLTDPTNAEEIIYTTTGQTGTNTGILAGPDINSTDAQVNPPKAPPSPAGLANSSDPTNAPKDNATPLGYISIPAAKIRAKITEVGVTDQRKVDVPEHTVGWFNLSSQPGQPGVSFLDGHTPGVFTGLENLKEADTITITLASGQIINYRVQSIRTVQLSTISMFELLTPPEDLASQSQFLALMTCTGEFDREINTYDHRTVILAERV